MREFNISLGEIFSGLDPAEYPNKTVPNILTCLNLVPTGTNYILHEEISDLNQVIPVSTTAQTADIWKDHEDDLWKDHDADVWKDNPDLIQEH